MRLDYRLRPRPSHGHQSHIHLSRAQTKDDDDDDNNNTFTVTYTFLKIAYFKTSSDRIDALYTRRNSTDTTWLETWPEYVLVRTFLERKR